MPRAFHVELGLFSEFNVKLKIPFLQFGQRDKYERI